MASVEERRGVNLHSLLRTGKFSDLKLSCEHQEFSVHKAILCAQSRVFSAECEGGFEESRTNVIKIEEFNADTVQRMLEFLYSGDYSVTQETDSSDLTEVQAEGAGSKVENGTTSLDLDELDNEKVVTRQDVLRCHLSANAIGDYYDIQPLCALSRSKLKNEVNSNWSPTDFLHLLTEACTTRKTGDLEFHRLLGQGLGDHLEGWTESQSLDALEIPGAVLTSTIASFVERLRSLQQTIKERDVIIKTLERRKSEFELQRWS